MEHDRPPPARPLWVLLRLLGLPSRAAAVTACVLAIVLAAASGVYGLSDPRFIAIAFLLSLLAAWYWLAIRWVDRHGAWAAKTQVWWLAILVICVAGMVALVFVPFVYLAHYVIPQNGMYPGLPAGSHFIAVRRPYRNASEVQRGDIVVFAAIHDNQKIVFIWRVVALPGDTIKMSGGVVVVNGQPLKRNVVRAVEGRANSSRNKWTSHLRSRLWTASTANSARCGVDGAE